ncbi:MAG TPA: trehalose-6-phosphate synthase [Phycisphaerales bacterium]|nr:trehalose-6-phosphate synthase [Phycisphaerales bacterium]
MKRHELVIISNRLPLKRSGRGGGWERSPGGLVTALDPVIRATGGLWIGWDGVAGRTARAHVHEGLEVKPVGLSARELDLFYHGFCNRTLWPLFHDAIRPVDFDLRWWEMYQRINERFARAAARGVARKRTVWIHDFHLLLVPQMLRNLRPDLKIGFFLHIPFPPEEIFARLPWRTEILHGMLGSDVVGFQTWKDAQNFSRSSRRLADAEGTDAQLTFHGHKVRVNSFPISIDAMEMERLAHSPAIQKRAKEIKARMQNRRIMLGVDRLDYTKGIQARLTSFEHLLETKRVSADSCVLVQVAVPSRETVPEYAATRKGIEETVGRINGEFSQPGHVAVHYFRRNLARDELAAWYLAADVMLVTPLCDGMNLVAKEYAATRVDGGGVLVLSEFAGAAQELRQAVLVNPYDVEGMAEGMKRALDLPRSEQRFRMSILRMVVKRHDVQEWSDSFLAAMEKS